MMFLFHFGFKCSFHVISGWPFFLSHFCQPGHHRCTIALHGEEAIWDAVPQFSRFGPPKKKLHRASFQWTDRFFLEATKKNLVVKHPFLKGKKLYTVYIPGIFIFKEKYHGNGSSWWWGIYPPGIFFHLSQRHQTHRHLAKPCWK